MRSTPMQTSAFLLFVAPALSWGNLGHRTIGYLSQMYMSPAGLQYFNSIINPTDRFDISDAAVWADSHREGPFAYTYNWHFIDARDSPPEQCQVVYERDCDARDECDNQAPSCVIGAIADQASQVMAQNNSNQAMKFLLHFVGDVHQPLHAENLERGGNEICIKWPKSRNDHKGVRGRRTAVRIDDASDDCPPHKKCTNLHSAWDTLMIEKLIDYQHSDREHMAETEKAAALNWAQQLFADGDGNPELDPSDCLPTGQSDQAIACALSWASESNNFVCSYVLKDGVQGVENQDLTGDYYEGAVPIIKGQISRAARRFAGIMNMMASPGSTEMDRNDEQIVMNEL